DGTPASVALQRETRTIPIVFLTVSDPIGAGFVQSPIGPFGLGGDFHQARPLQAVAADADAVAQGTVLPLHHIEEMLGRADDDRAGRRRGALEYRLTRIDWREPLSLRARHVTGLILDRNGAKVRPQLHALDAIEFAEIGSQLVAQDKSLVCPIPEAINVAA